jgi:GNAT superfamily N-acetyltransferase
MAVLDHQLQSSHESARPAQHAAAPATGPGDGGEHAPQLLGESGLPAADLTPRHLEHFFVRRMGGRIVGVVGLEPAGGAALLRSLAVDSRRRGNGLGRMLVQHAEGHARELGAETLYLLTTTAERFFAARGAAARGHRGSPRLSDGSRR